MKKISAIMTGLVILSVAIIKAADLPDDKAIMKSIYAPVKTSMPQRIFTPEFKKMLKAGKLKDAKSFFSYKNPASGERWLTIPDKKWLEIIPERAPITMRYVGGKCPFCGKRFGGVETNICKNPFVGKTRCCQHAVYARPKDMPSRYTAKPNYSLKIPHLDGKTIKYSFYVPQNSKKNKKTWFSNAGETRWANLHTVIYTVIPELEARVLFWDDSQAARSLAVIFFRLAQVYPGWPYYNPRKPIGFATCADLLEGSGIEDYLLPEVWDNELKKRQKKFNILSEWNTKGYSKLLYAWGYQTDGNLVPGGKLAEAWDLIYTTPAVQKYSLKKYGNSNKLDSLVRNNIFKEESLFFAPKKPTLINMMMPLIKGGLKIAIVAKDKNLFEKIYRLYDGFIFNHYFEDGVTTEGSFNYCAMMGFYLNNPWIYKNVLGVDFRQKYPVAARIEKQGNYPIKTLYNVESTHGDEHTAFFASRHHDPPTKINYKEHEKSQFFPFGGVACLRSGDAGSRLEAILDFQNQIMHAHRGRLNLQLFYEGINLLPDIGYCKGPANLKRYPFNKMKTNMQPEKAEVRTISHALEGHCTGAIDGNQWDKWTFVLNGYLGNPDSFVQYINIDGKYTYLKHPAKVSNFERRLVTVKFSNGRSCLVDIFRMKGGKRHDLFWHVPGKQIKKNTGTKVAGAKNVYDWYKSNCTPPPKWRLEDEYIYKRYYNWKYPEYRTETEKLKNPVVTSPGNDFWSMEWEINPADYMPKNLGRQFYEPWKKLLHPVRLKIWGTADGSPARERLLNAKGQWASNIMTSKAHGKLVAFKNGFDYLFFNRQGKANGLESNFVHILEPFNPTQNPTMKNVKIIKSNSDGLLLELEALDGEKVYIGTTFGNKDFKTPQATFKAQLAAWSTHNEIVLYDGDHLQTNRLKLQTAPSWQGSLKNVVGDITGKPRKAL